MASPTKSRKTVLLSSSDEERSTSRSSCDVDEEEIESLEEARRIIRELKDRHRIQARQLLICRGNLKKQGEMTARFLQERADQLEALSSQLLLLEARLIRKQKDIGHLLSQRDVLIALQQKALHHHYSSETGLQSADISSIASYSPTREGNLGSLNDSNSTVEVEGESALDANLPGFRVASVGSVARSVLDVVEPDIERQSLGSSLGLFKSWIFESSGTQEADVKSVDLSETKRLERAEVGGTFERLQDTLSPHKIRQENEPIDHVTTYNRVMSSNHRSVTKPKDVKYKRMNKGIKSKSLEELG